MHRRVSGTPLRSRRVERFRIRAQRDRYDQVGFTAAARERTGLAQTTRKRSRSEFAYQKYYELPQKAEHINDFLQYSKITKIKCNRKFNDGLR
jgi:hypothetical protein